MSKYSRVIASNTFDIVKQQIHNHDYAFFMRSKELERYNPENIETFTDPVYRYAYRLMDMAALVTSTEISHFLSEISFKLRNNQSHLITRDELDTLKQFLVDADSEYKQSKYVALDSI